MRSWPKTTARLWVIIAVDAFLPLGEIISANAHSHVCRRFTCTFSQLHVNGWRRRHHMTYSAGEQILPLATSELPAFAHQPHNVASNLSVMAAIPQRSASVRTIWKAINRLRSTSGKYFKARFLMNLLMLATDSAITTVPSPFSWAPRNPLPSTKTSSVPNRSS